MTQNERIQILIKIIYFFPGGGAKTGGGGAAPIHAHPWELMGYFILRQIQKKEDNSDKFD